MASVESILLYGSETRTVTKAMEKKLDRCYKAKFYVLYFICLGKINLPTKNYMEIYQQYHQQRISEG